MINNYLSIAMGGMIGALLRFAAGLAVMRAAGSSFPWGTLTVNLAGSLLIGIFWYTVDHFNVAPEVRHFLITGFLGAFTTFSTFSLETFLMLRDGHLVNALLYVGVSTVAGLVLAFAGFSATRYVVAHIL